MAKFGNLERTIARQLDNFPALRAFAKTVYQHLNFVLSRRKGFTFEVAHGWEIVEPSQVARTKGPALSQEEFVGYFNISPWSDCGRYFTVHRRSPGEKTLEVGRYDFEKGSYQCVGNTPVWTFQQAALSQWISGGRFDGHLAFNTVRDGQLGCQILSASGTEVSWQPHPVQHIHGQTDRACGINPLRLHMIGSDYGVDHQVDNITPDLPLEDDGLWLIYLDQNITKLAASLAEVIALAPENEMDRATRQELNHAWFSPSGNHIVFMHRWYNASGRRSALLSLDVSTGKIERVLETGMVSHYSFSSSCELIVWCRGPDGSDGYFVLNILSKELRKVTSDSVDMFGDGHPIVSVDPRKYISDSYPNRARQQSLFEFSENSGEPLKKIGVFFSPMKFSGANRVDLHPRSDSTRTQISIDSGHNGIRRTYIIRPVSPPDLAPSGGTV